MAFACALPASALARTLAQQQRPSLPAEMWGLEVDRHSAGWLTDHVVRTARSSKVNVMVLDTRGMKASQARHVRSLAHRYNLRTVVLPHRVVWSQRPAAAACTKQHVPACTLLAGSLGAARKVASTPGVGLVVVRVRRLPSESALSSLAGATARILVAVDVGRSRKGNTAAWKAAIARAATQPGLDLAVAPAGSNRTAGTNTVLTVLGSSNLSTPSAPQCRAKRAGTRSLGRRSTSMTESCPACCMA